MSREQFLALSNRALLGETLRLAADERCSTAALVTALSEVDSRRLYLGEGFSCMFLYCTRSLRLSESAAYRRIEVARVSRAFPQVLDALARGALNLTTAVIIAPHLTVLNADELIASVSFKGRTDAERIVAAHNPKPDAPTIIRRESKPADTLRPEASALLSFSSEPAASCITSASPVPGPDGTIPAARPPAAIQPLTATRYKIQFTADKETHDKLRHAQALHRHQIPTGDIGTLIKKALTLLIADIERKKFGITPRPRDIPRGVKSGSRRIPASVRRAVSLRDRGQCAFVGAKGRCPERGFLEFHHMVPFAMGGAATEGNISLRCRAHNGYEWRGGGRV